MTIDPTTPRRLRPAGHALIASMVGLLLASLLNAHALASTAERQEQGVVRTVATSVTNVLARVSRTLYLDRPRLAIDRLLGRSRSVRDAPPRRTSASPDGDRATLNTPTRDDPADAWIIGDSFMELLGPKLADELNETELVEAEVDFRFITGLTRPDIFDWPRHIARRVRTDPPDIAVVMFGGNDGQPVTVDGVTYVEYTSAWWDLYRRRVGEVMDVLRGDRIAYWVGLPVMKDAEFREHARQMNDVYRDEVRARPWMRYVSSWEVFTDADGRYADYLPNLNGDMRLMRYADGAHFTPSGALELALHVESVIARDWLDGRREPGG